MQVASIRVSVSQISTFRLCNRKWAFTRVMPRSNPSAELGTRVHTVIEHWQKEGKRPDTSTEEGRIAMTGLGYLPVPRDPLVRVETDFKFVRTVERDGVIYSITYTGRRDWVRAPEGTDDDPIIGDQKTTKNFRYALDEDELVRDLQSNVYGASLLMEYGGDHVTALWVYYTTVAPLKARPVRVRLSLPVITETLEAADETAIEMVPLQGKAPHEVTPDARACDAYGGCPYQSECGLTARERRRSLIAQAEKEMGLADKIRAKREEAKQNAAENPNTEAKSPETVAEAAAPPAAPAGGMAAKIAAARAAKAAESAGKPAETAAGTASPATGINAPEGPKGDDASGEREVPASSSSPKPTSTRAQRTTGPAASATPSGLPVQPIADKHLVGGLRDQLASSVVIGLISNPALGATIIREDAEGDALISRRAYEIADALIAARG